MPTFICLTCGTQYPESATLPAHCPICDDDRQYVPRGGQQWRTMDEVRAAHRNTFTELEPSLTAIRSEPRFGIGQRAILVRRPEGNVLWDCVSLIDDETIGAVNALGGIAAMGLSHPHFYSSMVEWSHAFGGVPIYLHESNRDWVMRPDPVIQFWHGETHALGDDVTLIRCGGHFPGSSVLHWSRGADGRGLLLTADTINVVSHLGWVSFMHSFPNLLPLPAAAVQRIVAAVEPFKFDRIYGGWSEALIETGAKTGVEESARRYVEAMGREAQD